MTDAIHKVVCVYMFLYQMNDGTLSWQRSVVIKLLASDIFAWRRLFELDISSEMFRCVSANSQSFVASTQFWWINMNENYFAAFGRYSNNKVQIPELNFVKEFPVNFYESAIDTLKDY